MNQVKIGKFIASCRKEKKITQQELAKKLGVTDKAISKWENGRCLMDIGLLKPLSECLDISIIELINGEKIDEKDVPTKSTEVVEKTLTYADIKIRKNRVKMIVMVSLITLFVIGFCFAIYKGIMLCIYHVEPTAEFEQIVDGLSMDKTMMIYKKTLDENDYLVVGDIKIRNDFSEFTRIDEMGAYKYFVYDEEGKKKASVLFGVVDTHINKFTAEDVIIFGTNDIGQFNSADRKYFLLRNDINDDIDFLNYISENCYAKSNLFTSVREMKENYALNSFVSIVLPSIDSTTLIAGDYSGYILNLKDNRVREVNILRNDKSYVFTFIGDDYTTDEYIQDILSTLEIK